VRHKPVRQPPPEKCAANARANEPKPPRVTPAEPASDEVPDGERLDEESPLNKLLRDDPPPEPWSPPDGDPCDGQLVLVCRSDAIPGRFGPQFAAGISA
jgi:hypothetical protein